MFRRVERLAEEKERREKLIKRLGAGADGDGDGTSQPSGGKSAHGGSSKADEDEDEEEEEEDEEEEEEDEEEDEDEEEGEGDDVDPAEMRRLSLGSSVVTAHEEEVRFLLLRSWRRRRRWAVCICSPTRWLRWFLRVDGWVGGWA